MDPRSTTPHPLSSLTEDQRKAARAKLLSYRADPSIFFREVLGINSHWEKQIEIARSVAKNKRTTAPSGHDVGKSFVAADIVLWFASCFPPAIVITTAPTFRQVEKVLWGEIAKHYHTSKTPLGGKLLETPELKFGPKWYAVGFSSDTPDAFQGFHEENILVVVDEAAGVEDIIFEQIESLLSNQNAKLLLLGNPTKMIGYFADSINHPNFHTVHVDCLESPNVVAGKVLYPSLVTKEWCDERKEEWGEDSAIYRSRVRGLKPNESEDTLIYLDWVNRSVLRHQERLREKVQTAPVLGVDVARFGANNTVLTTRAGRRILDITSYRGHDLMHTVGEIERLNRSFRYADICIDDNGVGGGVTDRLRELGYKNIVPVNGGTVALDPGKYYNKRSELAWRVREAFRLDLLDIPNHNKLLFESSNQYYDQTNKQQLRVMSKTMLKKKQLDSPDFFDSLCLTYEKELPQSLAVNVSTYRDEFVDKVHILTLPRFPIGVSRYMVLVPNVAGQSYACWCYADRKGLLYFYAEAVMERATSSAIKAKIEDVEKAEGVPSSFRYMPKVWENPQEKTGYSLKEQFDDYDMFFDEVEYKPELAMVNLREGLKYDKSLPFSSTNHPYIFFSPTCLNLIRAVKYHLDSNTGANDPLYETIHKAVGLLILAEPVWEKANLAAR